MGDKDDEQKADQQVGPDKPLRPGEASSAEEHAGDEDRIPRSPDTPHTEPRSG